jgi:DNA modification methylase
MKHVNSVITADCLEAMKELVAEGVTVHSVVSDPPFGWDFMNKDWDKSDNIAFRPDCWRLCSDLLRPGGHVVAFGSTRTYHRMVCAIEQAGFDIRDTLVWAHAQGFPKSRDVSKDIDRVAGAEREVIGQNPNARDPDLWLQGYGRSVARLSSLAGFVGVDRAERVGGAERIQVPITAPATPLARQWAEWGTGLKPSLELICLARKPLCGTVAANVLKHATGALNIGGCRVECADKTRFPEGITSFRGERWKGLSSKPRNADPNPDGRWPANFCHDGSDEVLERFPLSSGQQGDVRGDEPSHIGDNGIYNRYEKTGVPFLKRGDSASAARFFFCAKATKAERNGSRHPCVKPIALMRWLVRLVTPPGGLVLDPFAGTGTTGEAAQLEGFDYLLIERDPESVLDCERRLARPHVSQAKCLRRSPSSAQPNYERPATTMTHIPRPLDENPITIQFRNADDFFDMVYRGDLPGMILYGPGGLGKTDRAEKAARRHHQLWKPVSPRSPGGLIEAFQQPGGVVGLDDCDWCWDSKDSVNVLKNVLGTIAGPRWLDHLVRGKQAIPRFPVTSGGAFLSNRNFGDPTDFKCDIQPVLERVAVVGLSFAALDLYEYSGALAVNGMLHDVMKPSLRRHITLVEANEVLAFFAKNAARFRSLAPRELVETARRRIGVDYETWHRQAESQLLPKPDPTRNLPADLFVYRIEPRGSQQVAA